MSIPVDDKSCADFRALKSADGTFNIQADYKYSYCNERYTPGDTCFPRSYGEMFNCIDPNSWAYTGIFAGMAFSILGAGL